MKIETENEEVFGNVKTERKAFSIANSSKAFKILSSNIYKNKIRAIVRELSCNCLDAHKLNGNTRPFELTVPTWLSQQFIVRDFGPGLSDEDIMNLYTTYFASTKDQSNDFIGALGLGSKSPFSYTDIFTVKSYFDGKCTTYNASMINGEPSVTRVTSVDSSEPTGLEITIPTKTSDVNRWNEEVSYVLFTFPKDNHKVIGMNMSDDSYIKDEYYKNGYCEYSSYNPSINAIYGNIVYPLDECPGIGEHTNWITSKGNKVYIKFELGELDIQPSREELSFDEVTVENIIKRISKFDKELRENDIKNILEYESNNTSIQTYNWVNSNYRRNISNILLNEARLAHIKKEGQDTYARISAFDKKYKNDKIEKLTGVLGEGFKNYNSEGRPEKYVSGYTPFEFLETGNICRYIFINQDCSKTLPKLIKKSTNFKDIVEAPSKYYSFLVAPNITDLEIYKDACAISEHLEIKTYNISDIYKLAEFPEPEKAEEKKPKYPNGVKYTKSPDGDFYLIEDLFLSAKEIREYSGYYNVIYGEKVGIISDFDGICSTLSNSDNIKEVSFPICADYKSSPDSYVTFRPAAWKYLTKDNLLDIYSLIYTDISNAIENIKQNDIKYYKHKKIANSGASNFSDLAIKYMLDKLFSMGIPELEGYLPTEDDDIITKLTDRIYSGMTLMSIYSDEDDEYEQFVQELDEKIDNNTDFVKELLKDKFHFMYDVTKAYNTYSRENIESAKEIIDMLA